VSGSHARTATVRLYDQLFLSETPDNDEDGIDFRQKINPNSLEELTDCLVEPTLVEAQPGSRFQFLRQGYFYLDPLDTKGGKLVFNRIVSLRDSWAKIQKSI